MRVAFVHEWLDTWAGSEQVLAQMLRVFPEADLFAVVDFLPETLRAQLGRDTRGTTFIQRLPFARKHFRKYLPLMPLAVEQLDLRGYDLVISNSHAVAKGVITGPGQFHLCYCYSPPRYAWDMQEFYLGPGAWLKKYLLHRFRIWDAVAGLRPDAYLAISAYISGRIAKCYRRDAQVLHPPIDTDWFTPGAAKGAHYFTHSRLVAYKRIDLLVEAFRTMPERQLRVAGDGPERPRLERSAPENVHFLGHIDDSALREELRRARAFLFASEEDFGLAPLEAQACGTPVIAYGRGGVWETLHGHPGCSFFETQSPAHVAAAVRHFEAAGAVPDASICRANVLRFSRENFRHSFRATVETAWREWQARNALAAKI